MPYHHRRRRASLAERPVSSASLNDEAIQESARKGNDDSDSDDDSSASNSSDATFLQVSVEKHGRIPELFMDHLWSNDASIVFGALRELADIGSNNLDEEGEEDYEKSMTDRLWVFELGGPLMIISVLRKWNRYRKITIEGLRVMANLSANTGFRDSVFAYGGIEVTLLAMKNFKHDEFVQRNGCACIRRFCLDKKQNSVELVSDFSAQKFLIRAMDRFPNNLRLNQFAISSLFDFCALEQLRYPLVANGCIAPLRSIVERYCDSAEKGDATQADIWEKSRIILDRVIE
jgi:hypothetical protein